MTGHKKAELTWFARDLRGRWRVPAPPVDGPHSQLRETWHGEDYLAFSDVMRAEVDRYPAPPPTGSWDLEYVCGDCRHAVLKDDESFIHSAWDDGYNWSEPLAKRRDGLIEAVGDHCHDEGAFVNGRIRYYNIFPTGPWKVEAWASSWTEVFSDYISRLRVRRVPATPKWVFNQLLSAGIHDHGMGGGVEYPRHRLSEDEYSEIRQVELDEFGRLDLVVPEFRDPMDFFFYCSGFTSGMDFEES